MIIQCIPKECCEVVGLLWLLKPHLVMHHPTLCCRTLPLTLFCCSHPSVLSEQNCDF